MTLDHARGFDLHASNGGSLEFIGTGTITIDIGVSASITLSGSNVEFTIMLAKNGTVVDATRITRKILTGTDKGALYTRGHIELTSGDYLEIFADIGSGTSTVTVSDLIWETTSAGHGH